MISSKRWAAVEKPHIFLRDGWWFCKLGIYSQTGMTPVEAYNRRMALK